MIKQRTTLLLFVLFSYAPFLGTFHADFLSFFHKEKKELSELSAFSINSEKEHLYESPPFFNCNPALNNPGFESNLTDWQTSGSVATTTDSYSGSKAVKLDIALGSMGFWQNASADPGKVYIVSCYAKSTNATNSSIGIEFFDANWTKLHDAHRTITSTNYQKYTIASLAPANTAHMRPIGWISPAGSGVTKYDDICIQTETLPAIGCSNSPEPLSPSHSNYIFSFDDAGGGANMLDYDNADLNLCDNGNGTATLSGFIIGGRDAAWHASAASPCGDNDMWFVDWTLSNLQSWAEFQGTVAMHADCASDNVNLDYWDYSGTMTGYGCNAGRTIQVTGPVSGYKLQAGWGGNSHNCDFGLSTWFVGTENGQANSGDIYARMDPPTRYTAFRQRFITSSNQDCSNILTNNEFDNGTTGWSLYKGDGNATFQVDNTSQVSGANSARLNITTPGTDVWDLQLKQDGKSIEANKKYMVSFEAKATTERLLVMSLQKSTADYRR